ncbi:MAG: hypothetical protein RRB13_07850 [bacterium]|nr:hypothetical protein [bacterium]
MFEFAANEQLLADWVLDQNHHNGLFPPAKGWTLRFKLFEPKSELRPLFLFEALSEGERVRLLPLSPLVSPKLYRELPALCDGADQLVLLCGQAYSEELSAKTEGLPIRPVQLALSESGMKLVGGEFKNSRLEFRLMKTESKPQLLPHRMPLNPGLHEDEAILARCFHALFHQLNRLWLAGTTQAKLDPLWDLALPLFPLMGKAQRKEAAGRLDEHLSLLTQAGPLKGWLDLKWHQKKPQSQPVRQLSWSGPPENRAVLLAVLRRQDQALHLLRTQSQQTSYYDPETDAL